MAASKPDNRTDRDRRTGKKIDRVSNMCVGHKIARLSYIVSQLMNAKSFTLFTQCSLTWYQVPRQDHGATTS